MYPKQLEKLLIHDGCSLKTLLNEYINEYVIEKPLTVTILN